MSPFRLTNSLKCGPAWPLIAALGLFPAGQLAARNIYVNGIDISNAQSQELIGVNVQINEKGDVFIVAPQYQVHEEDSYFPLSAAKMPRPSPSPLHQKPQELRAPQVGGRSEDEEPSPSARPSSSPTMSDSDIVPASESIVPPSPAVDAKEPNSSTNAPATEKTSN